MQPGFGTQGSPRPQGDDHLPSVQVPMSTTDLSALLGFGQDLPKVAERCQPEQVLPGVLTDEELGAHREVDPMQLPEGTTMNPSQLPGFVDLQWHDNLPPSYICTTHVDPRSMDADGIQNNLDGDPITAPPGYN